MKAKVSVVIPIYGVEKYIERCARRLFEQTLDDMEFIFVDDCTKDRSLSILQEVMLDYPQRRAQTIIMRHELNKGLPAARHTGVNIAKGEFIAHCDSDDWVEPDMYKLLYEKAIKEGADVVMCDFNIADGTKVLRTLKGCSHSERDSLIEEFLTIKTSWSLWNKLFRREACYTADIVYPTGNMGEDFALTTQLLLNCSNVAYIPIPLYNYFFNDTSITRAVSEEKKMQNFQMNKDNADIVFGVINKKHLNDQYRQAIVSYKWYIKKLLWNTNFDTTKRKLWKKTYCEINNNIILNSNICIKDKVKFVLTYLGLYPKHNNG